jgi:hypothetical protein
MKALVLARHCAGFLLRPVCQLHSFPGGYGSLFGQYQRQSTCLKSGFTYDRFEVEAAIR